MFQEGFWKMKYSQSKVSNKAKFEAFKKLRGLAHIYDISTKGGRTIETRLITIRSKPDYVEFVLL